MWNKLTAVEKIALGFAILFVGLILTATAAQAVTLRQYALPTVHKITDGVQSCSIVMIAPGRAMTAAHCLGMIAPTATIDGKQYVVTEGYANPGRDVAVLIIPSAPCPCATIAVNPPQDGDRIMLMGFPFGQHKVSTYGESQGRVKVDDGQEMILTTAPAYPGMSGGGAFNESGELVGIISMSAEGTVLSMIVEVGALPLQPTQ
jgi:S1-C subfamily serine protease